MSRQQVLDIPVAVPDRVMTKAEYRDWAGLPLFDEAKARASGWRPCHHTPPCAVRLGQGAGEPAIRVLMGHWPAIGNGR